MKTFSLITASILLFCNFDTTASHRREKAIQNYTSPDKKNYIEDHFIYPRCRKSYYKRCYPNASANPTYCKQSESIQAKIQEEYQQALATSPKRARDYKEILKAAGFLKATKTTLPTSLAISTSPQTNDD